MAKKAQYPLEESLGYIVGRAGRAMANRLNHNFEKAGYDVTCEQWAVLMNLWQKNGQSQKDLAGVTCKDKTSITRLIHGLEKRNLVVRVPDGSDGRQKLIYLANKGKAFQQELLQLVQKTLSLAQEGIRKQDLENCKKVLRQVALNLS
jgi:DNA-binding MarR family transcriptional regulator